MVLQGTGAPAETRAHTQWWMWKSESGCERDGGCGRVTMDTKVGVKAMVDEEE